MQGVVEYSSEILARMQIDLSTARVHKMKKIEQIEMYSYMFANITLAWPYD